MDGAPEYLVEVDELVYEKFRPNAAVTVAHGHFIIGTHVDYVAEILKAPDAEKRLAQAAVKALRQVYSDLDSEAAEEVVFGQELTGYDVNFYCLDLTNTALVRGFRTEDATYMILCQAEDREFAEVEPVFRAITASLLRFGVD